VFRIDDWGVELNNLQASNIPPVVVDDGQDDDSTNDTEEFIQQAKTMVEDTVDKLDPWQMQELMGGLLTAMGSGAR